MSIDICSENIFHVLNTIHNRMSINSRIPEQILANLYIIQLWKRIRDLSQTQNLQDVFQSEKIKADNTYTYTHTYTLMSVLCI